MATENRLDLAEKSLDLIFMRNVTYHIPNRTEYLRTLTIFKAKG